MLHSPSFFGSISIKVSKEAGVFPLTVVAAQYNSIQYKLTQTAVNSSSASSFFSGLVGVPGAFYGETLADNVGEEYLVYSDVGAGILTNVISPSTWDVPDEEQEVRIVADGVEYSLVAALPTRGRLLIGFSSTLQSHTSSSQKGSASEAEYGGVSMDVVEDINIRHLLHHPSKAAEHQGLVYRESLEVYVTRRDTNSSSGNPARALAIVAKDILGEL